jgi:hypothetical protein
MPTNIIKTWNTLFATSSSQGVPQHRLHRHPTSTQGLVGNDVRCRAERSCGRCLLALNRFGGNLSRTAVYE